MTLLSSPRLALFGLVMLVLLAGGIAMFFLLGPVYGIVATGIAAFVDWTMLKILRRQLRTTVTVDGDGVHLNQYGDEPVDLPWSKVRLTGLAAAPGRGGRRARRLVVVDRKMEQMLSIPADFARFDELAAAVRERAPRFQDISLEAGESLKERLLRLLLQDVSLDGDGIRFILAGDETLSISWNEVRLAGVAADPVARNRWARRLFVCQDLDDRWMVVPEKYERFDELTAAVRERVPGAFHDLTLGAGEKLKDRLQSLLGEPPDTHAAGSEAAAGPASPAGATGPN